MPPVVSLDVPLVVLRVVPLDESGSIWHGSASSSSSGTSSKFSTTEGGVGATVGGVGAIVGELGGTGDAAVALRHASRSDAHMLTSGKIMDTFDVGGSGGTA